MEKETELNIEQILKLLPPDTNNIKDLIESVLIYCKDRYEFLPDILLALSPVQAINLCYIFSDKTIKFPDFKFMSSVLRDVSIYLAVKAEPSHKTVKSQSEKYELTIPATLWIVEKVAGKLEEPNPLKN